MATVFLARDVRYDRRVAVKVLNPELGAVLGAERFLSEIRVTATLQHPNLLPLFDSGEANGLLYYVMPFVEGETLRARLERETHLPVSEVVRLGSAIASALDYAHRNGVIHRDLKPENILLQDGQPLVADFGIALAVSNAGGARVTQTGLSLGTPQYMSPEQATGDRTVDARSDVYALGAILYECLTGEPPHTGATAQAIIARLMTEEPRAIAQTRKSVPAHVEAAIETALQKLPADRWATVREFGEALQRPDDTGAQRVARTPMSAPSRGWQWATAAGVLVAVTSLTFAAFTANRAPVAARMRFAMDMPDSVRFATPPGLAMALSPDGQTVAFLGTSASTQGGSELYLRRFDELDAKRIVGASGAGNPAFTPDGSAVVYYNWTSKNFERVSVEGGAPTIVAKAKGFWLGLAWGYGPSPVYATNAALMRLSDDGRSSRVIAARPDSAAFKAFTNPAILPDGKTVMARAIVGNAGKLAVASIDSGAVTGSPVTLVDGALTRTEGGVNAVLAPNGTLAFMQGKRGSALVVSDATGRTLSSNEEGMQYNGTTWSPNGQKIALSMRSAASSALVLADVWIYDVASAALTRLTNGGAEAPAWSPDGRSLAYQRFVTDSEPGIMIVPIDGSGPPRDVAIGAFLEPQFTPDGRSIVATRTRAGSVANRIERISLADTRPNDVLVDLGTRVYNPRVSLDGTWLAYVAEADGRSDVFVKPMTAGGGRVQVSVAGGASPRWGASGVRYYRAGTRLRTATISSAGTVVQRDSLFALPTDAAFDVTADGKRFTYVRDLVDDARPVVSTDWVRTALTKLRQR
jgi:serine/threonine-protein kinase